MRAGARSLGALLGSAVLGSACAREEASAGSHAVAAGEVWFEDVAARAGIDFRHVHSNGRRMRIPEIMGSGLGFADVDGDGFLDLYAVQSGELDDPPEKRPENRLYRNRGDGTFADVTASAGVGDQGYGMGCAFADCDDDGDVDLFVTNLGADVLYENLGDLTFADVTARAGTSDPRWSTSAAFFDYQMDGDLDLYVANYINWSIERELHCSSAYGTHDYCGPNNYNAPAADTLYRNDGGLAFSDVSQAAGIDRASGNGLGVTCGDYDADGWIDLYVANDQLPNNLWIARPDGTFTDRALISGCAVDQHGIARAGMGVISFDVANDGDLDLFVTNLRAETNTLYLNEGGRFTDFTAPAGLSAPSYPYTGFGVGLADFDHDGRLDLYAANGRVKSERPLYEPDDPYSEPNQLYRGTGPETFEEVPHGGLGHVRAEISRGLALGDYDNDGDVDVAILDNGGSVELLQNVREPKGHWIQARVLDEHGRDALGALVAAGKDAARQWRTVQSSYSYCSSNDPRVHFGLAGDERPVELEVRWLDGTRERFGPLAVDEIHTLEKGKGEGLEPAR
jgi:hypothetical protein